MSTLHAWFSATSALMHGSSVFRKPSGCTVNVTRMSEVNLIEGRYRNDEKYLGEVVSAQDGGCVRANARVRGITPDAGLPWGPDLR